MSSRRVTVFGGTGFLGRRIVRHLRDADLAVRIASRHQNSADSLFSGDVSAVECVHADVNDDGSVVRAVAGAWGVVNAVSLYVERGKCTFRSVHVEAAKRIAMLARQAGAETLVHISGIGADARSASPYIRSRGEGEAAVLDGSPSAKLVRPAVMFGPGDGFLTPLSAMLRRTPVFPMFASLQKSGTSPVKSCRGRSESSQNSAGGIALARRQHPRSRRVSITRAPPNRLRLWHE